MLDLYANKSDLLKRFRRYLEQTPSLFDLKPIEAEEANFMENVVLSLKDLV